MFAHSVMNISCNRDRPKHVFFSGFKNSKVLAYAQHLKSACSYVSNKVILYELVGRKRSPCVAHGHTNVLGGYCCTTRVRMD